MKLLGTIKNRSNEYTIELDSGISVVYTEHLDESGKVIDSQCIYPNDHQVSKEIAKKIEKFVNFL